MGDTTPRDVSLDPYRVFLSRDRGSRFFLSLRLRLPVHWRVDSVLVLVYGPHTHRSFFSCVSKCPVTSLRPPPTLVEATRERKVPLVTPVGTRGPSLKCLCAQYHTLTMGVKG